MSDPRYDIRTLSRLAKVTPRTVHFYVQQGLLPPASAQGPGARYDDDHLLRLRVIRRLQRRHLPLAEIRRRLGNLGAAELSQLLADTDERATPAREQSALDYIRGVLKGDDAIRAGLPRMLAPEAPASASHARLGWRDGLHARLTADRREGTIGQPQRLATPEPPVPIERSQWDRIALAPDVELHLRRPLSRDMNRRVDRLIATARVILEED